MVADIPDNTPAHEALLAAIARHAARAPWQQLALLLALAAVGAVAAAFAVPWSPALAAAGIALCAATALLALWELSGRSRMAPAHVRAAVQKVLAAVGVLLWFFGGMALLLALLGDPWQL